MDWEDCGDCEDWVDSGVDPSNPIQVMLAWGPQP